MSAIISFYLLFILVGGIYSIYHFRARGSWFIIGESFSILFTVMIFLYYYEIYPKPNSYLVPLGMLLFILYWELVENRELLVEEFKKDNLSKEEQMVMIGLFVAFLSPLFYVSGMLISSYF